MNFLPGDIVTDKHGGFRSRVVKTSAERNALLVSDPQGTRSWHAAETMRHAREADAIEYKAKERTVWQAEAIRRLLKHLEKTGIDSMHASDVRALLDIASKYISLPQTEYWKEDQT